MKKFLEEYGFAILAAIVVICLMVISTPVNNVIENNINGLINKFASVATTRMNAPETNLKPNTIIKLDNRPYVILRSRGNNQYLVMDIDGIGNKQFNIDRNSQNPSKCGYINGSWKFETCNNQYENSNIDVYLNEEYYNRLSFKDTIVEQNIQQNFYQHTWSNPNYEWVDSNNPLNPGNCTGTCVKQPNGKWIPWNQHTPIKGEPGTFKFINKGSKRQNGYQASVIKRKIYLPSINEISSIANVNDQYDMDKFLRNSLGNRLYMWFRDSRFENSTLAIYGNYNYRSLHNYHISNTDFTAHPTFVIDLSNVKYGDTGKLFVN